MADPRSIRLIVGLGNPGREYEQTRHNIGFLVVRELGRRLHAGAPRRAHRAEILEAPYGGRKLLLAMPQTYMNVSGESVRGLVSYYKLALDELLVVYDDLDLPLGAVRLRPGGSAGGHNGVKSLIASLGTQEFARVRVGIGRPARGDAISYVLGRWTKEEQAALGQVVGDAADAVEGVLEHGLEQAMNRFNGR